MRLARICRAKYPDVDGKGAAIAGGRWNSKGTAVVYTSSCGALAILKYRVHTNIDPGDLLLYSIELPDSLNVEKASWMPDLDTARRYGDLWVNNKRTPILAVPSVVAPRQLNYLLNPQHHDLTGLIKVAVTDRFVLDLRLFDLTPIAPAAAPVSGS